MKTTFGLSLLVCLMVADAPLLSAAGGGAAFGVNGAGSVAAGGGSGGHAAAAVSTGGAHASAAPAGVRGGAVSPAGNRSVSPAATTYNAGPRYVSGGFTPNASRVFVNNPAVARPAPNIPAARVHNAWTDPAPGSAGRFPGGAGGLIQHDGSDRRNPENFTGQVLYPNAGRGAPGDHRLSGPGGLAGAVNDGRYGYRFHHRGGYNDGPYRNGYGYGYPGVFIGGYDPYLYSGVVGDYAGADLGGLSADNGDVAAPATVAAISQPYPNGGGDTVQPPADPAGNGDAAPAPASNVQSNNGPDSLVEAVQAELSRRGYFGGKIDAIYNDATHAAIQRFQRDQKLPASGRINEATLHALQLD